MICPEEHELQDLVDGLLSEEHAERVEAHASECAECRTEIDALKGLVASARRLASDEAPERDLWPGIEAAIGRGARLSTRGASWLGLAAAAMLVAAVTWTLADRVVERAAAPAVEPALAAVEPQSELRLAAERARFEGGQLHVKDDLLRLLAVRQGDLDPATRETVDQSMEIIDRAVGEIATARREYPQNRALGSLLAKTYQREAALLKQINRL